MGNYADESHNSQSIAVIVDTLHSHTNNPDKVYEMLCRLYNYFMTFLDEELDIEIHHLALYKRQGELHHIIERYVCKSSTVQLFQNLLHQYRHNENIILVTIRLLTLCCKQSHRFQCECAKYFLWEEIHSLSKLYSENLQIHIASLECYLSLYNGNSCHCVVKSSNLIDQIASDAILSLNEKALEKFALPLLLTFIKHRCLSTALSSIVADHILANINDFKNAVDMAQLWIDISIALIESDRQKCHNELGDILIKFFPQNCGEWQSDTWPILFFRTWKNDFTIMLAFTSFLSLAINFNEQLDISLNGTESMVKGVGLTIVRTNLLNEFCSILPSCSECGNSEEAKSLQVHVVRLIRQISSCPELCRLFPKYATNVHLILFPFLIDVLRDSSRTIILVIEALLLLRYLIRINRYHELYQQSNDMGTYLRKIVHKMQQQIDNLNLCDSSLEAVAKELSGKLLCDCGKK